MSELQRDPGKPRQLVCAECGTKSKAGAVGWRAYLDDDEHAVTFCPECAEREFGPDA